MNGTVTIAQAGTLSVHFPHDRNPHRIRPLFHRPADLAAQRQALSERGVAEDRICNDHGLTGATRARPGLDQAFAAVRQGDTLVMPKLDGWQGPSRMPAPSPTSFGNAARDRPWTRRSTTPATPWGRCSTTSPPPSQGSKPTSSAYAPARAWTSPTPRGNCTANSPNSPTGSSGNSAANTPPASIPSAISPNPSPSQGQPPVARSTVSSPLSVRSCPLPESASTRRDVRPGSQQVSNWSPAVTWA